MIDKEDLITLFKEKVKTTRLVYRFVGPLMGWKIKRAYNKIIEHYSNKNIQGTFHELLTLRAGKRLKNLRHLRRPLNILYVGTDYLQDSSGILQGLKEVGNLSYFTKDNGEYGLIEQGKCMNLQLKDPNSRRLWQLVNEMHSNKMPVDILVGQMLAGYIDGAVLSRIRKEFGAIVVNIAMDDRHGYWVAKHNGEWVGTYGLIPHIDLAATAAPECVDWYLKEGCPAIFFPEASDPKIFYPMPNLPKIHDVCFVGQCYGIRKKIIMKLRNAGIKVIIYGSGWENGRIPTEDVPKLFAQSKIILGIGAISHCSDFFALKMRDFDGPMSGSLYLTQDNDDLQRLYEVGSEIIVYRTIKDCISNVKYFLQNDVERELIAKQGCEKAHKDHTWENRFQQLMQILKSIP